MCQKKKKRKEKKVKTNYYALILFGPFVLLIAMILITVCVCKELLLLEHMKNLTVTFAIDSCCTIALLCVKKFFFFFLLFLDTFWSLCVANHYDFNHFLLLLLLFVSGAASIGTYEEPCCQHL